MINLETIKLVLWDFDDTLCIHSTHSDNDKADHDYNIEVLQAGYEAYRGRVNYQVNWFLHKCQELNKKQGLISATRSYKHAEAKREWVRLNYGVSLENYCVGSPKDKLEMLYSIADAGQLNRDEILLVDDYWQNLEDAANAGFSCCTPMEIVNLWNEKCNFI